MVSPASLLRASVPIAGYFSSLNAKSLSSSKNTYNIEAVGYLELTVTNDSFIVRINLKASEFSKDIIWLGSNCHDCQS